MKAEERRAVGHRIRTVRERNGWGRDELARRLGVHAGSIARWETGGALPHGYTVRRIAELGGTTAEWLRTGHGRPGVPSGPEPADAPGRPGASDAGIRFHTGGPEDPSTGELVSHGGIARFLEAIAPPGGEPLRKLDALDGLRRMLTARGALPGWWYELRERVENGRL